MQKIYQLITIKNMFLLIILLFAVITLNYFDLNQLEIIGIHSIKFFGLSIYIIFKLIIIILFILLFFYLFIIEYKENKNQNVIKAGLPENSIKRLIYLTLNAAGGYSAFLTIKNEHLKTNAVRTQLQIAEEKYNNEVEKSKALQAELDTLNKNSKALTEHQALSAKALDFYKKQEDLREKISKSYVALDAAKDELKKSPAKESEIKKTIEAENEKLKQLNEARQKELDKFGENIKETIENLKKKSIPPLDLLSDWFENLDGIGKLAFLSIFSNTLILVCSISIIYTLFGNYLINRFNLEEKYPKLNKFIKLRVKFQNYYLKINLTIIICVCLIQILLNTAIIDLIFS